MHYVRSFELKYMFNDTSYLEFRMPHAKSLFVFVITNHDQLAKYAPITLDDANNNILMYIKFDVMNSDQ